MKKLSTLFAEDRETVRNMIVAKIGCSDGRAHAVRLANLLIDLFDEFPVKKEK